MEFDKLEKLDHTARELFNRAGVRPGDVIFIVTVKKGRLFLGGKTVVVRICGQREAEEVRNPASGMLFDATEHPSQGARSIDSARTMRFHVKSWNASWSRGREAQ